MTLSVACPARPMLITIGLRMYLRARRSTAGGIVALQGEEGQQEWERAGEEGRGGLRSTAGGIVALQGEEGQHGWGRASQAICSFASPAVR